MYLWQHQENGLKNIRKGNNPSFLSIIHINPFLDFLILMCQNEEKKKGRVSNGRDSKKGRYRKKDNKIKTTSERNTATQRREHSEATNNITQKNKNSNKKSQKVLNRQLNGDKGELPDTISI